MPPVSSTNSTADRARLHAKFSTAATALAELYRESSNAYEAGYRDALLFVQRYLQLSTPTPTTAATATGQQPPSPSAHSRSSALCATVNAAQMMSFLQDTAAARRERMAVVRGVHSLRRRQRDVTDAPDGFGEDASEAENDAAAVRMGDHNISSEDGEEEEPGLTPQSSPASAGPHSHPLHPSHAANVIATTTSSSSSPHATLNRDIELITLLEPPVQPHRQRRRTDRPHSAASHRRVRSPRGHPFSLQMPVGRGK